MCLNYIFLKTLWEKEKLLVMSNFSFSHSIFYLIGKLSVIFIKFEIVVSKLLQFGRLLNLSFGKGLKGGKKDDTNDIIYSFSSSEELIIYKTNKVMGKGPRKLSNACMISILEFIQPRMKPNKCRII